MLRSREFPFRLSRRLALLFVLAWLCQGGATSFAQQSTINGSALAHAPDEDKNGAASTFGQPVKTVWDFGLKISSSGEAAGIKATVPVPRDWPEQTVRVLGEQKDGSIGRFKITKPTKETLQLEFQVRRIGADQPAVATQRYEVQRRPMLPPDAPNLLKLADPVPSKLRRFLKPSPYIESKDRRIKEIAEQIKSASGDGPAWSWVEAIYRYVRENVEYEFDTQIHSCLDALNAGKGDCEELSSLFIAICRASGIPARAVWIPGHTYPEFYLVDFEGNGHWFPCQAAGIYEFGGMNETRPVLQKGDQFRLPGQHKKVRYLRPTLIAKGGGASLSLEWIARDVTDGAETEANDTTRDPNESSE